MSEPLIQSSGNVFTDLGFPPEEAENLRIRSELMMAIKDFVQKEGLTRKQAAERLGVAQPRSSEIFQGKIELFSVDNLISLLSRVGQHVTISIVEKAA